MKIDIKIIRGKHNQSGTDLMKAKVCFIARDSEV